MEMNSYTMHLFDSSKGLEVEAVTSFVGEDSTGSFGILPGHARFMTVLVFGLARFCCGQGAPWQYLAMPGGVLYFADNTLNLVCRHYLIDEEYESISRRLIDELVAEEEQLHEIQLSLKCMEEALLRRMWELGRQGIKLS
jgi:F-type H+-transporting ATPase subunit epsilon